MDVQNKRPRFKCDICERELRSKFSLQNHMSRVHLEMKDFNCEICDKCFKSDGALLYHVTHVHGVDNQVQCQVCENKFPSQHVMEVHLERDHQKKMRIECDICGKKFSKSRSLNFHMTVTHGDKQFKTVAKVKCIFCEKKLILHSNLDSHMRDFHKIEGDWQQHIQNWNSKSSSDSPISLEDDQAAKYPFILYLHRGINDRTSLEGNELKAIKAFVEEEWWRQYSSNPDSVPCLKIDQTFTSTKGQGIMTCLDLSTREWICKTLETFSVEGVKYRAWRKDETGMTTVTTLVTDHMTSRTPEEFMKIVIANQADAIPKNCRYEVVEVTPVDGGRVYKVQD